MQGGGHDRFDRAAGLDTFNAASNVHMLRINRAMGFREVESVIEWQLTV
jgi:hypothetical protein